MLNNNQNIMPLMAVARRKCENANIEFEFISLPEDLLPDVASHVNFHGISMKEAIPTLVFNTENGFIIVQKRADTKIDSTKLKKLVGVKSMNFATPEQLHEIGAEIGIVPLTGLSFPHYVDENVLELPIIYGGSGSKLFALKLNSADLITLNNATIGDFTKII